MRSEILARLRERPMNGFQLATIGICLVLNMLDGFDVLAMSFTAPGIREEWKLGLQELGVLISAGLAGMTIGSLAISPFADKIGRRNITLICVAVTTLGMLLSGAAQGVNQLIFLRFLTGLGIGGMLPSLNTLVAEYASDKRRDFAISAFSIGYPIGTMIGGIASVFLIESLSWRGVFVFGGLLSAAFLPVVALKMPESVEFLLFRRPPNALKRLNSILRKLGEPELSELPPPPPKREDRANKVIDVLGPAFLKSTILICACYFMVMLTSYFILGWLPTLLVDLGLSPRQGISGSIVLGIGGVSGGLAFGWLSSALGMRVVAPSFMIISFVGLAIFAVAPEDLAVLMPIGAMTGFFMIGSTIALYALVPLIYPAEVRATGTGLSIGIGRIGAVFGPYLGGVLLASGLDRPVFYLIMGLPLLIAAALVTQLREIKPAIALPSGNTRDFKV